MGLPRPVERHTPQEYYALEAKAEYKSEYYRGQIFAMSGGSKAHSEITVNLVGGLWQRLRGQPCRPYEGNFRLKVIATGLRCYPDVSVYCGPIEPDPDDPRAETGTNPTVVFEVLSKSTEGYDRGFKASNFRQVASLRAYVLVSQETAHVEVYERKPDDTWLLREASGLDGSIPIPGIEVTLPLAEVYDRVEFPPAVPIEELSDPVRRV